MNISMNFREKLKLSIFSQIIDTRHIHVHKKVKRQSEANLLAKEDPSEESHRSILRSKRSLMKLMKDANRFVQSVQRVFI